MGPDLTFSIPHYALRAGIEDEDNFKVVCPGAVCDI